MDTLNSNSNVKQSSILLVLTISFVFGLLWDYFFFDTVIGLSFPIFIVLTIMAIFMLALYFHKSFDQTTIILAIAAIISSSMVFIRSSKELTFVNSMTSFFLTLLMIKQILGDKIGMYDLRHYLTKIIPLPFEFLGNTLATIPELFQHIFQIKNNRKANHILRGVLITIPIAGLFLLLFSAADLVFKKYLIQALDVDINAEFFVRSFFVLLITAFFFGAMIAIFQLIPEKIKGSLMLPRIHRSAPIEILMLISTINIIFFSFIIVQLTYLFGGAVNILEQGYTYSEYARRGFFELIIVAVLSLILILTSEKYTNAENHNYPLRFSIPSVFLIAQVIVVMIASFKRLLLYEDAYGFTILRFYSHAFIIFLAVLFLMLLYKLLINKADHIFVRNALISGFLFLGLLNFVNPDSFIARQNIDRYYNSHKIDIVYLRTLSNDAIPEVISLFKLPRVELERISFGKPGFFIFILDLIDRRVEILNQQKNWQSLNISNLKALGILNQALADGKLVLE